MTDIIARGMAANAGMAAELAVEMISNFNKGLHYKGRIQSYSDLPTNPAVGDAYTIIDETTIEGITYPAYTEFAWGDDHKWSPISPIVDQIYSSTSANAQSGIAVAQAVQSSSYHVILDI